MMKGFLPGTRVNPNERITKLKAKLYELPTKPDCQESNEKIEKYLSGIKSSLTNNDNEQDRLLYAESLLKFEQYAGDGTQIQLLDEYNKKAFAQMNEAANTGKENSDLKTDESQTSTKTNQTNSQIVLFSSLSKKNLVSHLIFSLHILPFECKKTTSTIISCLFHKNNNNPTWNESVREKAIQYFEEEFSIIAHLLNYFSEGAEFPDCLNAGEILGELCKIEELAKIILNNHWKMFFDLGNLKGFDKLGSALQLFNNVLTWYKSMASKFLAENHETFLRRFNEELIGPNCNFVTKKQCIKLLANILSNRENYRVMLGYVQDADNLKVIMRLLQEDAASIQLEAFHVFKIFVANPQVNQVPPEKNIEKVAKILYKNKESLINFLKNFQKSNDDENMDHEFESEKKFLINAIENLQNPAKNQNRDRSNTGTSNVNVAGASSGTTTTTGSGQAAQQQGAGEPSGVAGNQSRDNGRGEN